MRSLTYVTLLFIRPFCRRLSENDGCSRINFVRRCHTRVPVHQEERYTRGRNGLAISSCSRPRGWRQQQRISLSFGGYREGRVQPRLSLPSNREPAFRFIKELQVVVCSAMCLVIARCHCTARYDTTTNNDLLLSALLSRISSGPVPRNFFVVF